MEDCETDTGRLLRDRRDSGGLLGRHVHAASGVYQGGVEINLISLDLKLYAAVAREQGWGQTRSPNNMRERKAAGHQTCVSVRQQATRHA